MFLLLLDWLSRGKQSYVKFSVKLWNESDTSFGIFAQRSHLAPIHLTLISYIPHQTGKAHQCRLHNKEELLDFCSEWACRPCFWLINVGTIFKSCQSFIVHLGVSHLHRMLMRWRGYGHKTVLKGRITLHPASSDGFLSCHNQFIMKKYE